MPQRKKSTARAEPERTLATGADARMSAEQAMQLRQLALDASEPEAFNRSLTRSEAARRITMLQAKLTLMDEPPHTL